MENQESNQGELISDYTEEKFCCQKCYKPLEKFSELYFDEFLFKVFAYLFCSEECRDNYINSK